MVGIFIALLSGALMSVQGVFNTEVTKGTSMWVSNSWVQFSALAVCLVAWFFTDRASFAGILEVQPKYMLLGGVIGAFITYTVIRSMSALGPAQSVMLIVVSQLLVAYLIELFGMFGVDKQPFEWRKLIGMAVCAAGIILFKWES
ncbi:DMT family transporter [Lachnospiraceae bacterium 29-84]